MSPNPASQKLPRDVKVLDLTGKQLSIVPVKFSNKSQLQSLTLTRNTIHDLPKNLKKLSTLAMPLNGLKSISSAMLEAILSYPMIQSLDFSYNLLKDFPPALCQIKTLKTLNLFGHQLVTFDGSQLTSLTKIDLGHNRLKSFPQLSSTVGSVALDSSRIEVVAVSFEKLGRLSISSNRLRLFSAACSFSELTVLDISRNSIVRLPDLDQVTPRLQQFNGSGNHIRRPHRFPRTILEMNLSHNHLVGFPPSFGQLSSLVQADLSRNAIEVVPQLPSGLQTQSLYENRIVRIDHKGRMPELSRL
jgi:Leucine-rich repeat (LRR) protein